MMKRLFDDDHHEEEKPKKITDCQQQEEEDEEVAKPIGKVVKVSRYENGVEKHYHSFEFNSNVFQLEDSVLVSPEDAQKPYVAIIKDITEDKHGNVMVTGQWFYRPEEAKKVGGGYWEAVDSRELFYSFHLDDFPAESVMHKCVIHFIPPHKQLPLRSQHPGFIVQKVYEFGEKRLWKLTDKISEDKKQQEIDLLIRNTQERLGELPDIVLEDSSAKQILKSNKNLGRTNMYQFDPSKIEPTTRLDKLTKGYVTTGGDIFSKYHDILEKFGVLTGAPSRDKWLERLLQGIQLVCHLKDAKPINDKHKRNVVSSDFRMAGESSASWMGHYAGDSNVGAKICWPDTVIPIISMLEWVTYEALGGDFQKYNQKMRQLDFNLKKNSLLAKRLMNKELEPIALLSMTPDELKEGLTTDERTTVEPEETEQMQIVAARCSRCMSRQAGLTDIISDRYQLECTACGYTWHASPDVIASLTEDPPSPAK